MGIVSIVIYGKGRDLKDSKKDFYQLHIFKVCFCW